MNTRRRILWLLTRDGMLSIPTIAERLSVPQGTVYSAVHLARDLGQVHIGGWKHGSGRGRMAALYSVGCGRDAPRPAPLTPAEIDARCWARKTPEARAARARLRRLKAAPATWCSGLGA